MPDPFSVTGAIGIGPTPGLTLDNPATGSSPQNPPNPGNPTSGLSTSTMETLVKTLLERMAAPPAPKPTTLKTDYDKPPTYNVQKLDENATGSQIQDWVSGITRGNEDRLHCSVRSQVNWACSALSPTL
jgi:hypothetical protein